MSDAPSSSVWWSAVAAGVLLDGGGARCSAGGAVGLGRVGSAAGPSVGSSRSAFGINSKFCAPLLIA